MTEIVQLYHFYQEAFKASTAAISSSLPSSLGQLGQSIRMHQTKKMFGDRCLSLVHRMQAKGPTCLPCPTLHISPPPHPPLCLSTEVVCVHFAHLITATVAPSTEKRKEPRSPLPLSSPHSSAVHHVHVARQVTFTLWGLWLLPTSRTTPPLPAAPLVHKGHRLLSL